MHFTENYSLVPMELKQTQDDVCGAARSDHKKFSDEVDTNFSTKKTTTVSRNFQNKVGHVTDICRPVS
jgi:hypothetical protein